MFVYKLEHCRNVDDSFVSTKLIGYFAQHDDCKQAMELLRRKPGFCDYPDDFYIFEINVIGSQDCDELTVVYDLTYERILNDDLDSEVVFIGVYASYTLAKAAINALCDFERDCFCIDKCIVGMIEWRDGFDAYI